MRMANQKRPRVLDPVIPVGCANAMQKRKKKGTPRSNTGCSTCRTRRLKCGEERPRCNRCARAGLQCGGYEHVKSDNSHGFHIFALRPNDPPTESVPTNAHRRIQKAIGDRFLTSRVRNQPVCKICWQHVSSRASGAFIELDSASKCWRCGRYSLSSKSPSPTEIIPFRLPGNDTEREIFHHFIVETIPDCSAYTSTVFWNDIVLPHCHEEDVARSCTLALGAVHREVAIRAQDPQGYVPNQSYMLQYNKALTLVQKYLAKEPNPCMETVMSCCSLFYAIEIARGDYAAAHRHARAGVAILQEWHQRAKKQSSSNKNFRQLDEVQRLMEDFAGLDVSMSFSTNFTEGHFVLTTAEERAGEVPLWPITYSGVDEAWVKCNKLMNWGCHLLGTLLRSQARSINELPPNLFIEMQILRDEVVRCNPLFLSTIEMENSRAAASSTATGCVSRAYILNISFQSFELVFRTSISGFLPGMSDADMCKQSESIIAMVSVMTNGLESGKNVILKMTPFLFLETAVGALSLVRMVCKDEVVRQKALGLLDIWSARGSDLIGEGTDAVIEAAKEVTRPETFGGRASSSLPKTQSIDEDSAEIFQQDTGNIPTHSVGGVTIAAGAKSFALSHDLYTGQRSNGNAAHVPAMVIVLKQDVV
ncbi:hypothetical protein HYALB_00008259 [Hymenoscyphus albidus]|uniref:Zn(2)-C6 fungal-type domain-containing protein n=1 Tax=Hymenoscyphus albidus TaxID=595503 RepID=A0A9N9Q396_9HELO|nr:hypothetical protein HYALB_00008259 [Hymenoscyphus albidus]